MGSLSIHKNLLFPSIFIPKMHAFHFFFIFNFKTDTNNYHASFVQAKLSVNSSEDWLILCMLCYWLLV